MTQPRAFYSVAKTLGLFAWNSLRPANFSTPLLLQVSSKNFTTCHCNQTGLSLYRLSKSANHPSENVNEKESLKPGSSTMEVTENPVFSHAKHNMYVCWHPEAPIPYEMTKPLDFTAPITESHLKVQSLTPVKEAFRSKNYRSTVQELVHLTYSTKHRFYGQHGKRRRLVFRDMDPNKQKRYREYL